MSERVCTWVKWVVGCHRISIVYTNNEEIWGGCLQLLRRSHFVIILAADDLAAPVGVFVALDIAFFCVSSGNLRFLQVKRGRFWRIQHHRKGYHPKSVWRKKMNPGSKDHHIRCALSRSLSPRLFVISPKNIDTMLRLLCMVFRRATGGLRHIILASSQHAWSSKCSRSFPAFFYMPWPTHYLHVCVYIMHAYHTCISYTYATHACVFAFVTYIGGRWVKRNASRLKRPWIRRKRRPPPGRLITFQLSWELCGVSTSCR